MLTVSNLSGAKPRRRGHLGCLPTFTSCPLSQCGSTIVDTQRVVSATCLSESYLVSYVYLSCHSLSSTQVTGQFPFHAYLSVYTSCKPANVEAGRSASLCMGTSYILMHWDRIGKWLDAAEGYNLPSS